MNPLNAVSDISKAISYPFRMLYVVGLCFFINWFTTPGHWWFQWVAFGMGIGLIAVWARAFRALGVAALTAGVGYVLYRWFQRRNGAGSVRN
jgi:hypothetical protein